MCEAKQMDRLRGPTASCRQLLKQGLESFQELARVLTRDRPSQLVDDIPVAPRLFRQDRDPLGTLNAQDRSLWDRLLELATQLEKGLRRVSEAMQEHNQI